MGKKCRNFRDFLDNYHYSIGKTCGWLNGKDLKKVKTGDKNEITGSYLKGTDGKKYDLVTVAPDGLYLITVFAGSQTEPCGPYKVFVNGKVKLNGITAPKG